MVVEAKLRIWPMPNFPVMIINLNTTYRELAASLLACGVPDSIAWAPWIILGTVHNRLWSTTVSFVEVLPSVLANVLPSTYSKGISMLLSPALDSIE